MAGHSERYGPGVPKELDRYLVPSEEIVFLLRRHWVVIAEPFLTTLLGWWSWRRSGATWARPSRPC